MRPSSSSAKETVAFWTKLGAVWPHDDGKGYNLELIALPLTAKLVIRERKEASD
jgi:hypothetical protein